MTTPTLDQCHDVLDDGTICCLPAVADWHDPDQLYVETPLCKAHAGGSIPSEVVWRP